MWDAIKQPPKMSFVCLIYSLFAAWSCWRCSSHQDERSTSTVEALKSITAAGCVQACVWWFAWSAHSDPARQVMFKTDTTSRFTADQTQGAEIAVVRNNKLHDTHWASDETETPAPSLFCLDDETFCLITHLLLSGLLLSIFGIQKWPNAAF